MNRLVLLVFVLAACASNGVSASASWPGFRGPNSSGVGPHCNPPTKIGTNDALLWKVPVPWSPSSPCVWGDFVFLTTFADNELQTQCYQRRDGKLLWSQGVKPEKLETFHSTESSPAASTLAIDGERVVSYFGSFGLVCYDLQGKELWRHVLPTALSLGGYGTATCPLIAGNLVVISRDRDDASSVLAVDLRTGEKVWETSRPDAYGSFGHTDILAEQ